jgi:hypothetical protein
LYYQIREGAVCGGVKMQLWLLDDQHGSSNPADAVREMLHNYREGLSETGTRIRKAHLKSASGVGDKHLGLVACDVDVYLLSHRVCEPLADKSSQVAPVTKPIIGEDLESAFASGAELSDRLIGHAHRPFRLGAERAQVGRSRKSGSEEAQDGT